MTKTSVAEKQQSGIAKEGEHAKGQVERQDAPGGTLEYSLGQACDCPDDEVATSAVQCSAAPYAPATRYRCESTDCGGDAQRWLRRLTGCQNSVRHG